jgi:hypothetical protein
VVEYTDWRKTMAKAISAQERLERKEEIIAEAAEDILLDILANMDENGVLDPEFTRHLESSYLKVRLQNLWNKAINLYAHGKG